jgi:phosphoribosylamine---glycine ligase
MKKNVLILGSGGREHALAHCIQKSPLLAQLFVLPGNTGTIDYAMQIPVDLSKHQEIIKVIQNYEIDIVVCGPEVPLAEGLMDAIQAQPWPKKPILVGPGIDGAKLESSKAFSKEFMSRHRIPTAAYKSFTKSESTSAVEYINSLNAPIVIKASGLAAGKGVVICEDHNSALKELQEMFDGKFGISSDTIVIEEFLKGIEFSVFILTNGQQFLMLPQAKDYKRIGEGDTGLNTGGMGAVSPVPFVDEQLLKQVEDTIIRPTLAGLKNEKISYQGFIFFWLILVNGIPKVIEYNCRLGDPETEVILPRLKTDLIEIFLAMDENRLDQIQPESDHRTALTIMMVSDGYPGNYPKGKKINLPKSIPGNSMIFHAGTKEEDRELLTNGGRVLSVTSLDDDIKSALSASLELAHQIEYEGKYFRTDIGLDLMDYTA